MASLHIGKAVLMNLFLIFMLWNGGVEAQSQCSNSMIIGLSPCLSYVSGNTTIPAPACCLQLSNLVQTAPQCLCTLLSYNNNGTAANFNINQTLALTLPTACNVQTPPLSQCNVISTPPATAPIASPEAAAASPTETSTNPQTDTTAATTPFIAPAASTSTPSVPSASKTLPGATKNSSNGVMVAKPFHVTALIFFFLAAFASNHVVNI